MIVAVTVGTIIQSSIGFGLALVVVPTLTLIRPDALPATILLIALPMTTFMALRERRSIDVAGLRRAAAARLPGTLAGVMLLAYVPDDSLSVVIGSLIIVAAGISALRPQLEVGRGTSLVAGFASGLMGTAAGIGGPPMPLLIRGGREGSCGPPWRASSFLGRSCRSQGWDCRAGFMGGISFSRSSCSPASAPGSS